MILNEELEMMADSSTTRNYSPIEASEIYDSPEPE